MNGKTPRHARAVALVSSGTGKPDRVSLRRWASGLIAVLLIVISVLPSYPHALQDGSQPGTAIVWSVGINAAVTNIDIDEPESGQTGSQTRHGHQCLACACTHVTLPSDARSAHCIYIDHVRFHSFVLTHLASLAPSPLLRPPRA